jgi:hypothetical protein
MKRHIALFCAPQSLASLAQVHTLYRVEAERMLYRHMAIPIDSKCAALKTLTAHPHKALLVRSLTVEFPLHWDGKNVIVFAAAASLCDVLGRMPALIGLRIILPYREDATLKAQINQVLR